MIETERKDFQFGLKKATHPKTYVSYRCLKHLQLIICIKVWGVYIIIHVQYLHEALKGMKTRGVSPIVLPFPVRQLPVFDPRLVPMTTRFISLWFP